MAQTLNKEIKFSHPGNYQIQVLGSVPPKLWDFFNGETDQVSEDGDGKVTTSLKIYVRDQAELTGLINMLYEWRLVLLSVRMDGFIDR